MPRGVALGTCLSLKVKFRFPSRERQEFIGTRPEYDALVQLEAGSINREAQYTYGALPIPRWSSTSRSSPVHLCRLSQRTSSCSRRPPVALLCARTIRSTSTTAHAPLITTHHLQACAHSSHGLTVTLLECALRARIETDLSLQLHCRFTFCSNAPSERSPSLHLQLDLLPQTRTRALQQAPPERSFPPRPSTMTIPLQISQKEGRMV
jgi:hypothetical protein